MTKKHTSDDIFAAIKGTECSKETIYVCETATGLERCDRYTKGALVVEVSFDNELPQDVPIPFACTNEEGMYVWDDTYAEWYDIDGNLQECEVSFRIFK